MKKFFALIFAALLCLSLAACGDSGQDTSGSGSPENSSAASSAESEGIEVDENLLTVDITFPASLFEGQDMSTFDPDAYATENGFKKAIVNEDGSVTVTMTKAKHKELLAETSENIKTSFSGMIKSEDTPYITDIQHSDSFDSVDVMVSRTEYENAGFAAKFVPFSIYMQVAFYQAISGDGQHCDIKIVDADTGDAISSVVYPDALNSAS